MHESTEVTCVLNASPNKAGIRKTNVMSEAEKTESRKSLFNSLVNTYICTHTCTHVRVRMCDCPYERMCVCKAGPCSKLSTMEAFVHKSFADLHNPNIYYFPVATRRASSG